MKRLLTLLATLASCSTPSPPSGAAGPVEAAQEFAAAIQRGDGAAAHALLSSRTQREAEELAVRARKAAGDAGTAPASGRQMLLASALPQGKVEVRKLSQDDAAAVVEVTDAAESARKFRVVREGGVWKLDIDLPAAAGR